MLPWSEKINDTFMANELYLSKVLNFQEEFFKRLKIIDRLPENKLPDLFIKLRDCDEEIIRLSLGDIGLKLKNFISQVDLNHPEISNVFDGILADNQEFSRSCNELIDLAGNRSKNICSITPFLNKLLYKEHKTIVRKINCPSINRINVRFLKDPEEREQIRCSKKMQIVDLHSIYKKGKNYWDSQPNNFSKFIRFDTSYHDDLEKAEKKAKRYEDLGCLSLAEEIRKTIDLFIDYKECNYFGFNRIAMTTASIILAKSLGFNYIDNGENVVVNKNFFYNFDPESPIEYNSYISMRNDSTIFTNRHQTTYNYESRVYPYHEFSEIASDETKKIIFHLENFPDVGDKPIFDHFCIIVPGVEFPLRNSEVFSFLDKSGIIQKFNTREEAIKNLDLILIKDKNIYPIIIGEKDGKCYFISYFQSRN